MFAPKIEVCFAYVQVGKHSFLTTQLRSHGIRGKFAIRYILMASTESASEIPICPKYVNWNHTNLLTAESSSYY